MSKGYVLAGSGSYGKVYKNDKHALKRCKGKFFSVLITEIACLKLCLKCPHIVNIQDFSLENFTFTMDSYDSDMLSYLRMGRESKSRNLNSLPLDLLKNTFVSILSGMDFMHSRNLIHCDIKLTNILVNSSPFKVVIADCGLMGLSQFANIANTSPIYCDRSIEKDWRHDMFSFGIMATEIISCIKINSIVSLSEIRILLKGSSHKNVLLSAVDPVRWKRPTALALCGYFKHFITETVKSKTFSYSHTPRALWKVPVLNTTLIPYHDNVKYTHKPDNEFFDTLEQKVRLLYTTSSYERVFTGYRAIREVISEKDDIDQIFKCVVNITDSLHNKRKYTYSIDKSFEEYQTMEMLLNNETFLRIIHL
jgi:serine/threonine protein kinase